MVSTGGSVPPWSAMRCWIRASAQSDSQRGSGTAPMRTANSGMPVLLPLASARMLIQ